MDLITSVAEKQVMEVDGKTWVVGHVDDDANHPDFGACTQVAVICYETQPNPTTVNLVITPERVYELSSDQEIGLVVSERFAFLI